MEVGLAQGKKMPPITFEAKSLVFANGNRVYATGNEGTQTDTLSDEALIATLAEILNKNPQLQIELSGHTTFEEPVELGLERAELVRKKLLDLGVQAPRILVANQGNSKPMIDQASILALPTAIEKQAAIAKNRRVEISVVRNDFQLE
jgi:outer membrane protein OmpA-like peptidoglycan-associated protein